MPRSDVEVNLNPKRSIMAAIFRCSRLVLYLLLGFRYTIKLGQTKARSEGCVGSCGMVLKARSTLPEPLKVCRITAFWARFSFGGSGTVTSNPRA